MLAEEYFQRYRGSIIKQLSFVRDHVPFYRDLDVESIKTYSDFVEIVPVVSPDEFVRAPEQFYSGLPIEFVRHSSSTSGKAKRVFLTKHDLDHWAAAAAIDLAPYYSGG